MCSEFRIPQANLYLQTAYLLVRASTFEEGVVMAEQWVDFGDLKQWLSMADILGHYGLHHPTRLGLDTVEKKKSSSR
jgi:hypothetical protein